MSYTPRNRDTVSSPENKNGESHLSTSELDTVFKNLCDRHRRIILLLVQSGDIETKTDLLSHDAWDTAVSEVALVHRHLPKLHEAGYIEWNRQTDTISKGPEFDKVDPVLDLFATNVETLSIEWP